MKTNHESIDDRVWDWNTGLPGLGRHRNSGRYYSRLRVNGKRTMKALKTDVLSVARVKHTAAMAEAELQRHTVTKAEAGVASLGELLRLAKEAYESDSELAEKSKVAFHHCIERIEQQWTECFGVAVEKQKPEKITKAMAAEFGNHLHQRAEWRRHNTERKRRGYGPVTVNKTLEALHRVLRFAHSKGFLLAVPFELTAELGEEDIRKTEPRKRINFPGEAKVREVFAQMRTVRDDLPENQQELRPYLIARANESADLAEFMAYSGARVQEAVTWTWEDERQKTIFIRGTKTETSKDREVPKLPAMHDLLRRMKERRRAEGRELKGRAFVICQCREALESACKRAGVERWTHHSLRHLFATICIESGVDVPTIAGWLGHADRGVLAMQTYGHLRQEHSLRQAAKITFGVAA